MPRTLTPEQTTSRPDFLLSRWDRRAELGSFGGNTKHPGSKPGFTHHHLRTELREHTVIHQPEAQVPPKIEGIEAVDSPLMAAAFFSLVANTDFVKKHGPRLLVISLALALTTCLPQSQSVPGPESPPAVTVVTNTPVFTDAPTATLAPTLTETPFFGGGPELPGGAPDQIRSLLEAGINLPITDCVVSPETGGDRKEWDNWINTLVENGASRTAIEELRATINAKLEAQVISSHPALALELCSGGGGGWSFAIRDESSGLLWWSNDFKNNRFADRPDKVFTDGEWNFGPMPTNGLKSGLEVKIMMINGWPLAVAVNPEGKPVQHFDPVLGEFINFYPDTPTPTRTASATPTTTNTPRPTAIPATRIPIAVSTPIPTIEPSSTVAPTPVLPCDQRGGPENECTTNVCFISDYDGIPKGVHGWFVEWYVRQALAAGAVTLGDCP